jgi:hypothetical protein
MDDQIIEPEPVNNRFQGRTRRPDSTRQIDLTGAAYGKKIGRADIGDNLVAAIIGNDNSQIRSSVELLQLAFGQRFQHLLQPEMQRRPLYFTLRLGAV